jgi:cytochrome c oxidase cbb3-type subunit III
MRSVITCRVWIAAATLGIAATVSLIAAQAPPPPAGRAGAQAPQPPATGRARGGVMGAGPADAPFVDAALAMRGRTVWAAECINCHGSQARGTDNGPNLTRSLVVLRDRYGSELGTFLKRGHKMQGGAAASTLSDEQILDLAHFLRQRVNDSFRGSPLFQPQNVLVGDAAAGAAFFNGEGRCATCHTATTLSLAGIGARYEPIDLQQRFLFPGPGRGGRGRGRGPATGPPPASAVKVTVTTTAGDSVTGVLLLLDDFNVSVREASGGYRTFKRSPGVKVVKDDPLAAHRAMLDTLSDRNMHDVVAYLETLK